MADELLDLVPDPTRRGGLASRAGVWVGLLTMFALGGAAVWAVSDRDADPVPGDGPLDGDSIAVEFGGPYNGFESIGFPVQVEPSLGLVDQQSVVVTASQFPPNRSLAVVQCWGDGQGDGGVQNCDAGNYGLTASDESGNVTADYVVRRFISTGLGEKDCAAVEAGFGCVIAVANIEDYDESGTAATFFDPTVAGEPAPVVAVTPVSGLRDGDVVTVSGTGMTPGDTARITQCVMNVSGIPGCFSYNPTGEISVGPNGAFEVTIEVRRLVDGPYGGADCVVDPYGCSVVVAGQKIANPVTLRFDGGDRLDGPSYTLEPSGGLVDGSTVTVGLTDLGVGTSAFVVEQCVDVAGGASCEALDSGTVSGDALTSTVMVRRMLAGGDGTDRDCADPARRCYLRVETDVDVVERLPLDFEEVS